MINFLLWSHDLKILSHEATLVTLQVNRRELRRKDHEMQKGNVRAGHRFWSYKAWDLNACAPLVS